MAKSKKVLPSKKPAPKSVQAVIKAKHKDKPMRHPSFVKCKAKRTVLFARYKEQVNAQRHKLRDERKQARARGEVVDTKPGRTLENTRSVEATMVADNDPEVHGDEEDDEFAPYFNESEKPKILITTRPKPSAKLYYFIADLQKMIPDLRFYPRQWFSVKEICKFATNRGFTHLMVLSEKAKRCNGLTISHLRPHKDLEGQAGPTAFFKLTNVVTGSDIPNHGTPSSHIPELNLHGFGTRLGHRVGRLLGSLFPHDAQFRGRQVVTFHNQRDFVFVRQHRYIFDEMTETQKQRFNEKAEKEKAAEGQPLVKTRLQELGPRFTLKLRWLQEGTFDTKHGEYEWFHKRKEMDTTRRKFHL